MLLLSSVSSLHREWETERNLLRGLKKPNTTPSLNHRHSCVLKTMTSTSPDDDGKSYICEKDGKIYIYIPTHHTLHIVLSPSLAVSSLVSAHSSLVRIPQEQQRRLRRRQRRDILRHPMCLPSVRLRYEHSLRLSIIRAVSLTRPVRTTTTNDVRYALREHAATSSKCFASCGVSYRIYLYV